MILRLYKRPKKTGWLGYIENKKGTAIGFVKLNGQIIFDW